MAEKKSTTKRTLRTPEERLAAAQAEVERIKLQATAKDRKRHAVLTEQRAKLVVRIGDLENRLSNIDDEVDEIEARVPELRPTGPSNSEG